MDEGFAETHEAIAGLARELGGFAGETRGTFQRVFDDLAVLKGDGRENWYRNRAAAILGRRLKQVRPVQFADLEPIRSALKSGRISESEWDDLALVDLFIAAKSDNDKDTYVAMEIAWTLDDGDIVRAARRAGIVRRPDWIASL